MGALQRVRGCSTVLLQEETGDAILTQVSLREGRSNVLLSRWQSVAQNKVGIFILLCRPISGFSQTFQKRGQQHLGPLWIWRMHGSPQEGPLCSHSQRYPPAAGVRLMGCHGVSFIKNVSFLKIGILLFVMVPTLSPATGNGSWT